MLGRRRSVTEDEDMVFCGESNSSFRMVSNQYADWHLSLQMFRWMILSLVRPHCDQACMPRYA